MRLTSKARNSILRPRPLGLRKNSASCRFWEGHEFHSCRNGHEINNGFQPLRECCAGKTLFPQAARGFTLIEMVVVISMILVLLSIALPMYTQSINRAREAKLKQNLATLNEVIEKYSLDKGKAPQSLDDLVQAGYIKAIPRTSPAAPIPGRPTTKTIPKRLGPHPDGYQRRPQRFRRLLQPGQPVFVLVVR